MAIDPVESPYIQENMGSSVLKLSCQVTFDYQFDLKVNYQNSFSLLLAINGQFRHKVY